MPSKLLVLTAVVMVILGMGLGCAGRSENGLNIEKNERICCVAREEITTLSVSGQQLANELQLQDSSEADRDTVLLCAVLAIFALIAAVVLMRSNRRK